MNNPTRFQVEYWYPRVMDDLQRVPDAIEYYSRIIKDGEKYIVPKGNLENLLAAQAGVVYFYESARNDASKIKKYLDERLSYDKARKHMWLQSKEGRTLYGDLKATDLKQYVEADNDIFDLTETVGYIEAIKLSLDSLIKALEQRGMCLSMIAKVRSAGQSEIMIDASQESPLDD